MSQALTPQALADILTSVPPVDLAAQRLLAAHDRPGVLFPRLDGVDSVDLGAAVEEIVAYTAQCSSAAERLAKLNPCPLTGVALPEFGL